MATRASFPPGDAREDWAILRALSDVLKNRLPYDSLAALRQALFKAHPHLMRIGQIAPGDAGRYAKARRRSAAAPTRRRSARASRISISPIRSRAASAVMAECSAHRARARDHDGGGVGHDDGRVLVRLYLAAGDHGGGERAAPRHPADRRRLCAVGRPQDLGGGADPARPERGRALGPVSILRRSAQIRAQGAGHSGRRQQGRVPARAARHLRAGARRLGGDPGQCRLGDLQHQCRHPLYLRHLLARRVRRDHGRLGVELEISVPRRAALGGADGVLRSLDRLRHHHRAALRRLAQSHRHRRGAADHGCTCSACRGCRAGTGCRCSRCW